MRLALFVLCLSLAALGLGQGGENLFATTKPDVSIVVRKHPAGPDLVEITMQEPKYPEPLLRQQVARLGEILGNAPTGLSVGPYQIGDEARFTFTRAFFAVRGLVDRQNGILRVEPFAKAFAGIPEPHGVDVLMIQFEGERPTQNTLRAFFPEDRTVRVQAIASPNALGVEFRVQLLTQDPNKISIPDDRRQPAKATPAAPAPKPGPDWVLYGALGAAALAVGALVYSLLLRARPRRA